MKNKKGFTLVEMLVSFTLSMILIIILFQLIINLKEIYLVSGVKTHLLNKQYLITNKIYKDLNEKVVTEIIPCNTGTICVEFVFSDDTSKTLEMNNDYGTLKYDDYTITLDPNSTFGVAQINTAATLLDKRILTITVEINNKLFKDTDFGINIVYPYYTEDVMNTTANNYIVNSSTYTTVPYIQSNGNQYIPLDYKAKTNTEIRLDMELIANTNTPLASDHNTNIIGRAGTSGNNLFGVDISATAGEEKKFRYWVDKTSSAGGTTYAKTYTSVTDRSTMILKSGAATFQDESYAIATKTADNEDEMILLGNFNGSSITPFDRYDVKIYGMRIYEGATLVKNLVPAHSASDVGLYDTINNTFYPGSGTSDFTYE